MSAAPPIAESRPEPSPQSQPEGSIQLGEYDRLIEAMPGPQSQFIACEADICVFGGSPGGSKSYSILLDVIQATHLSKCRDLIVRRQLKDLTDDGGLIDDAKDVFCATGATFNGQKNSFRWPSGHSLIFGHMEVAADSHLRYKSKQYARIYFEELTEFEEHQFWYMTSRNRSVCGIRPYMRATTNPQPGWVADLLMAGGYVDYETGYAIPEMSGVIRWIARHMGKIHWFDTLEACAVFCLGKKHASPMSFCFIRSQLSDNKILTEADPDYEAKLMMTGDIEAERLLDGNWKITKNKGRMFKREYFRIIPHPPICHTYVRYWDKAATEVDDGKAGHDPDYTAGVLLGMTEQSTYVVIDVVRDRLEPLEVEELITRTSRQDRAQYGQKAHYIVGIEQEGGSAGKTDAAYYTRLLAGFDVRVYPARDNKVIRATPIASQVKAGNVAIVEGQFNNDFFEELENFPSKRHHDDMCDALSGCFNSLETNETPKTTFWADVASGF